MRKKIIYDYRTFVEGLRDAADMAGTQLSMRAFAHLQFAALSVAWCECDLWHPDTDKEQAMAWAWEDVRVAFAGYGDSVVTGAIINYWGCIGIDAQETALRIIGKAAAEAERGTSPKAPRRFLKKYRTAAIRNPDEGYELPAIIPVRGHRARAWADQQGLPPVAAAEQMALLEEQERMGLIDLACGDDFGAAEIRDKKAEVRVTPTAHSHLSLVQ